MDVPVEEYEAEQQGGSADQYILSETELFQLITMLEEIAHEEKTETTYKAMIGDVWNSVIIFVHTIENHGDDRNDQHEALSVFAPIEHICQDVHQEQRNQEPGDTVEFAGETAVELPQ